jgi:SNF2 family DNA or RNA helicase
MNAPEFDPRTDYRELLLPNQKPGQGAYIEQNRTVFARLLPNDPWTRAWWLYVERSSQVTVTLNAYPFPWSAVHIIPELAGSPLLEENERPPWDHQLAGLRVALAHPEYFALFCEQRTGKSWIIVKFLVAMFLRGEVDALLLLAPNGVHANWLTEALTEFLPRGLPNFACCWRSGKMASKPARAGLDHLLSYAGLSILAVNYDALRWKTTKNFLGRFVRRRKFLIVADEADDLSSPDAKRTKTALAAAKWAKSRAVLTGTPAAESPFSLYSITNFLSWGLLGFSSSVAFRHHYGVYPTDEAGNVERRFVRGGTQSFDDIERDEEGRPLYRNLEELNRKLSAFSYFVTREECGGQLPRLSRRVFALGDAQRTAYDDLRDLYRAELAQYHRPVTARMVLVRYARLQQITSGFVPLDREPATCGLCNGTDPLCERCDGLGVVLPPPEVAKFPNARLDALERELRGVAGAVVVWTRFVPDADVVINALRDLGRRPGRYDGRATDDDREHDKLAFQRGDLDAMVASPQAGGRGLDFSRARTSIFYSHHWALRLRLQAQDRTENLARKDPQVVVDLVAEDTLDELITGCHEAKRDVQDVITGRKRGQWL